MKRLYFWSIIIFALISNNSQAQPGSLDLSFDPGNGAVGGRVYATCVQPDGKIIIGGNFYTYNSVGFLNLVRVNANGSIDTSFHPGSGANYEVRAIALQQDGRILIGGQFNSYNGNSANYIARLNADGTFDASFNTGTGLNDRVHSILIQPNGKIIAAGNFEFANSLYRSRIVRFNSNGSVDTTLYSGNNGINDAINSAVLLPNGKIVVVGNFSSINSVSANHVARLNPDGSIDATFNIGTGTDQIANCVVRQPDGKIIIAGHFYNYNNTPKNQIARIDSTGALDNTFDPGASSGGGLAPLGMALQADGKLVVGGMFIQFNNAPHNFIVRLNTDGSVDNGFATGSAASYNIHCVNIQPDGNILIGGAFWLYDSISRNEIARLIDDCTPSASSITITSCVSYIAPDNLVYTNSGTYTAHVQNASGCDSTITINLTINEVDTSVTQTASNLTANITGASYQWVDCSNGNIMGTNQTYTPQFNGNYAVIVTFNNCTDTSECHLMNQVGLADIRKPEFSIAPNPTSGNLNINLSNTPTVVVATITDVVGRIVLEQTIENTNTFAIETSTFNSGTYYITLQCGESRSTQRFIKE